MNVPSLFELILESDVVLFSIFYVHFKAIKMTTWCEQLCPYQLLPPRTWKLHYSSPSRLSKKQLFAIIDFIDIQSTKRSTRTLENNETGRYIGSTVTLMRRIGPISIVIIKRMIAEISSQQHIHLTVAQYINFHDIWLKSTWKLRNWWGWARV